MKCILKVEKKVVRTWLCSEKEYEIAKQLAELAKKMFNMDIRVVRYLDTETQHT